MKHLPWIMVLGLAAVGWALGPPKETAARALRRSQRLLGLAREAGSVGFFTYDVQKDLLAWLPSREASAGRVEGRWDDFLARVCPEDRDRIALQVHRALEEEQGTFKIRYRNVADEGASDWVESRLSVRYDENSNPVEILGVTMDLGERAEIESLREALAHCEVTLRQQSASAQRDKDEFLAMLSHELRNPLNSMATAVEVLQRPNVGERAAQGARDVLARQTQRLAGMMNEMFDVTGVLSGQMRLHREPTHLAALAERVLARLEASGEAEPNRVHLELSSGLWVDGDALRLEQVLTQLLANALRYTPAGSPVTVQAHAQGDQVLLGVSDTGNGIAPELLPRIFDLFKQGERPLDRRAGGLGVGLTLAKRLVELHGGSISASNTATGSYFEVRLPSCAPAAATLAVAKSVGSRRVLVIEDNLDAKNTLCDVLTLDGHQVASAEDGATGLDMLVQGRPEIAIVDIGLPSLDGFQVALRARAAGYGGRMIAVSGYGHVQDAQRAMRSGFDAHMAKPLDAAKLRLLLQET